MAVRTVTAGRAATAVHDYTDDARPNTIAFTTGQRVTDIKCHPGPMWYGSANGSSGWFHRNYVLLDELAFTDQQLANMNALSRDLCMPYLLQVAPLERISKRLGYGLRTLAARNRTLQISFKRHGAHSHVGAEMWSEDCVCHVQIQTVLHLPDRNDQNSQMWQVHVGRRHNS
jgi:hypothetical protein